MPDREKVLKGLECCLIFDEDWFYHCDECPYRATEDERKVIDWCCHLEELRKDALELLKGQEPDVSKYQYKISHTDCIWYSDGKSRCPVTCSQYRDGWNDAMDFIFKNGAGYSPYKRR